VFFCVPFDGFTPEAGAELCEEEVVVCGAGADVTAGASGAVSGAGEESFFTWPSAFAEFPGLDPSGAAEPTALAEFPLPFPLPLPLALPLPLPATADPAKMIAKNATAIPLSSAFVIPRPSVAAVINARTSVGHKVLPPSPMSAMCRSYRASPFWGRR
jgi:hypothetical protein